MWWCRGGGGGMLSLEGEEHREEGVAVEEAGRGTAIAEEGTLSL